MKRVNSLLLLCLGLAGAACAQSRKSNAQNPYAVNTESKGSAKLFAPEARVVKTEEEWKKLLSPEAYQVMRQKGTERAFTSPLNKNKETGEYQCASCGLPLFASTTKFESGTGWPSFFAPLNPTHVRIETDRSFGMLREEVDCARCGAHLGHVFEDGPAPTGLRYCMNGISLKFAKK